jgi:competence protein ComEC
MPIISVLVMPAGLAALLAMPFGLDGPLWRLMGFGIDWMTAVALWVGGLPGAIGRVTAFGVGALLVITAGLVALCLLRSRLRYAGVVIILAGCGLALSATRPDVMISSDGDAVAVRMPGGSLSIQKFGGAAFAITDWLGSDSDARKPDDKNLGEGFSCDENGCVARLRDNAAVAVSRTAAALAEDCVAASLVITQREAPPGCAATVVDRKTLRASGALDLWRAGPGWRIEAATPPGTDRPWARRQAKDEAVRAAASRPAPRDATPRAEDLEADD